MRRREHLISAALVLSGFVGCVGQSSLQSGSHRNPVETPSDIQYQHDERNSGVTRAQLPSQKSIRWQTELPRLSSGIAVANDRVICAGSKLYALDAQTGDIEWTANPAHSFGRFPAIAGNTVYVTTWSGGSNWLRGLVALSLEDGSERWRVSPSAHFATPPTIANDTIYVTGDVGYRDVRAFDRTDGTQKWLFRAHPGTTAPAVANGMVFVGGGKEPPMYALDAETGDEAWQFAPGYGGSSVAPTAAGNNVYIAWRWYLYELDPTDGTERWRTRFDSQVRAPVASTGDSIYVPTSKALIALDTDGNEQWSVPLRGGRYAPTVAGDSILIADRHDAICLDATDGTEFWRQAAVRDGRHTGISGEPGVADETVYIPSDSGDVRAITQPE